MKSNYMKHFTSDLLVRFVLLVTTCLYIVSVLIIPSTAFGLSAAQKQVIESNLGWFDVEKGCSPGAAASAPTTPNTPGKIYVLGDSLTAGVEAKLKPALEAAGFTPTINGQGSRPLFYSQGTVQGITDGFTAVDSDQVAVKEATTIVIGLGTNRQAGGDTEFQQKVGEMIDKMKGLAPSARIFWTNLAGTGSKDVYAPHNQILKEQSTAKSFTVIDWASKAASALPPDDVHPTAAGYDTLSSTIVDAVRGGASTAQTSASVGAGCACATPGTKLSGSDNKQKIWNFLTGNSEPPIALPLTAEQAAGVMGNIQSESGFDPGIQEHGSGIGFGLIQWSFGRRTELEQAARAKGVPASDLAFQLDFLYEESNKRKMKDDSSTIEWVGLTRTKTVEEATLYWEYNAERAGVKKLSLRTKFSEAIFQEFTGQSASGSASGGGQACGGPVGPTNFIQKVSFSDSATITPTAVVLHWWAGTGGIDALISVLQSRGLSVQLGTTVDGKVYQLTPQLNSRGAHASCANGWSIGNEIEGGVSFGPDPLGSGQRVALDLATNDAQFKAVVDSTWQLMKQFNIPIDGPIASDGSSGVGVHSHKETSAACGSGGKQDVDDVYLKRVKDELRKREAGGV